MIVSILAITVIVLLCIIGLMHFYWAFGGRWATDAVIPTVKEKPMFQPGSFVTFFVGGIFVGFAYIAYVLEFSDKSLNYAGGALSVIFLLRAIGDFYAIGFFKKVRSSKFARLDTKLYSPLSLFIGIVFLFLAYK